MNSTMLHIRTDKAVKKQAETVLKDLGLNTTTAVNLFLRAVTEYNGIPFVIKSKKPNKETLEAIKELESGGGYVCNSVDELLKSIN